ncbi:MAG: hypothetical protein IAF02_00690 [Anaerolineae bacterium]|nr:hypothetical protein [Anaerolineae bacterium]
MNESSGLNQLDHIKRNTDLTELEKIVQAFDLVTKTAISYSTHEIEIALALGDKETAVKERIKSGGIHISRGMFEYCYREITGSREAIWHE